VRARGWLTWERRTPGSAVLVVTNMWPDAERPPYGVFVQRQVDDVARAGVPADVLYLRGYRSPLAYAWAAAWFALASASLRRYSLVHVHAGETAVAARFHVGTPMLVSYCGDDVLGDPREDGSVSAYARLRSAVVRAHSRLFPAVVVKSQEMHDRLPSRTRRRTIVLPNGVDTRLFRPLDRADCRRELGWSDDERVALFAGTRPDSPRKRRRLAEAACAAASELVGPVRLHVAGSVPPEQMPVLMNAADCLLLTSSVEGSPNVVKEALMCNLPVVATPAGDVPLLLNGVEPSAVCRPDARELGNAVAACIASASRSNGREVATWLDGDRIAERLVEVYERLGVGRAARTAVATESAT
jgi:teichuronic acid biosynthesis glycosyltransferase TuaC